MNKTNIILTGFAIFASILMFSTTCIAAPVQQIVSIEAVEYEEQETINNNIEISANKDITAVKYVMQELILSIKNLAKMMENDPYLINSIEKISKDPVLNSMFNSIQNTNDLKIKSSLANSFFDTLGKSQDCIYLKSYIQRSYSNNIKDINIKINRAITLVKEKGLDAADLYKIIDDLVKDESKLYWYPGLIFQIILSVALFVVGLVVGVVSWSISPFILITWFPYGYYATGSVAVTILCLIIFFITWPLIVAATGAMIPWLFYP